MHEVGAITTDLGASPWGWLFYNSLQDASKQMPPGLGNLKGSAKRAQTDALTAFRQNRFVYQPDNDRLNARRIAAPVYDHDCEVVGAL